MSELTSLGVSAGAGMIHYVLLTRDDLGRSVVDSRVIDVDTTDGLDTAGRVNAGIDVMLTAARESDTRVGPIGVAARSAGARRALRSRGSGPRRQVRLVAEDEAVLAYLADTGEIDRYTATVVVDCGDTGMSLYTVQPGRGRTSEIERSTVLSGRRLDRAIVDVLIADESQRIDVSGARLPREELIGACRTAKEELAHETTSGASSVTLPGGSGRITLDAEHVARAAAPMVREARAFFDDFIENKAGASPEAVVFVGGLANLPFVREIAGSHDLDVVCPAAPELVTAGGAALVAQQNTSTTAKLAFIGGHRQREWLSATPLAVAGAIIAAALMTVYAVSASFADRQVPEPVTSPVQSVPAAATSPQTSSETTPAPVTSEETPPTENYYAEPTFVQPTRPTYQPPARTETTEPPAWATTELPPMRPSTSTRTLQPFPWEGLPFPPGSTPIPPEFLPPALRPPSQTPAPGTTVPPIPAPPVPGAQAPRPPTGDAPDPQSSAQSKLPLDERGRTPAPVPGPAPAPSSPVPSVPAPR